VIPNSGLIAVWGPPKCGKSFWVFDLVMHVALGWPYRGRRVQQGPVVYCAFEGAEGFKDRAEAYRRKHTIPETVPFYLIATNAKLVRDQKALIESIAGQIGDLPPVCVVLDTLNRSIDGSESKDVDMGAYLDAADAIDEAFACAVLIVHHCGVDGSRPRGHTSLTGNIVSQLAVKRDAEKNVIVEVEAMKDGVVHYRPDRAIGGRKRRQRKAQLQSAAFPRYPDRGHHRRPRRAQNHIQHPWRAHRRQPRMAQDVLLVQRMVRPGRQRSQ
jgi:hypothetical protein